MRTLFQLGLKEDRPLWLRMMALLCVLAVCMMSTAQISHTHAEFSSPTQRGSHPNGPAPVDHCPLCVAMHSALSAPQQFTPAEPTLSMQRLDFVAAEAERTFRWRFELACRPPPASDIA